MAKLNAKKLKEEFDALDDEDKDQVRKALGVEADEDVMSTIKKFGERLEAVEKREKGKGAKKDGFFAELFSSE